MPAPLSLRRRDVLVVITTAPTGLGHLRVTAALQSGLPKGVKPVVLGLHHPSLQLLHALSSRNRPLRVISEFLQNHPLAEDLFTRLYRRYLTSTANHAFRLLTNEVKKHSPPPAVLVIVSTHFSLAHQIATLKPRLQAQLHLCPTLAVVVTDDSPQKTWAVPGADYIFTPSLTTQLTLEKHLHHLTSHPPQVVTSPYPLAIGLQCPLTPSQFHHRRHQVQPALSHPTHIIIPISGAAVQLKYFQDLIHTLSRLDSRSQFTVVSRASPYTSSFLDWCHLHPHTSVLSHTQDTQVIRLYEQAYRRQLFSLEITKPSEQAFKALLAPHQRGGSLLLFSPPIGRQESDNLEFLRRHHLLPSPADAQLLSRLYTHHLPSPLDPDFLARARHWRALTLPPGSGADWARAILAWRTHGLLWAMTDFSPLSSHPELQSHGSRLFWTTLSQLIAPLCPIS